MTDLVLETVRVLLVAVTVLILHLKSNVPRTHIAGFKLERFAFRSDILAKAGKDHSETKEKPS